MHNTGITYKNQASCLSKFIYQIFITTYPFNKISAIGICIKDLITGDLTRKLGNNLFAKTIVNWYGAHL